MVAFASREIVLISVFTTALDGKSSTARLTTTNDPKRIALIASDLVAHFEKRIEAMEKRHKLANRFKDSKDPFRIVIVRDMWLTGFDAPCLHTMYADKPM